MKRCPTCNRSYADETLRFCLDDGVQLITNEASPYDPHETLRIAAPRGTDPTSTESLQPDATDRLQQNSRSKRRSPFMVAAAIAVIFFTASIVVSYFYFSKRRSGATSSEPVSTASPSPNATPTQDGRWFVFFGTYPKSDLSKANERLGFVQYKGYDARLIDTDDYPNLKNSSWAVVMGPFRKDRAQEVADKARSIFSDVSIKSGW